jgi:hypothetical protein
MRFVIERYFKTKMIATAGSYSKKDDADKMCNYMNEKMSKISPNVTYKVKQIDF